jgi:glycogen debranching enzyme
MANLGEIPQSPYYGTVDATPLFLILLGECCNWLGSLELFDELRDAAMAALAWIEQYGDEDGDGYIDYRCRSERGLRNQGWKDSWNGVVMGDGRLAEPPIALVEVQGYVYRAWRSAAWLLRHSGDAAGADRLDAKAADLYARFNRDFWMPDLGYYAFCRQGDGRFSNAVASNAAHALWTGIVDPARAADVVARAMASDMFNGWGLRTLSSDDASYNPVDYQVGSVWPHDTSFAVAGMCRYGHKAEAAQIFTGMVQAAARFAQFRLPETFAGYDRTVAGLPVRYPVACNPQAWAAASVPFMLASLLGIVPDGCAGRVRLVRPYLPEWLSWVEISGLRAAGGSVDVRFERQGGATTVASLRQAGGAVQVEW